MGVPVDVAAAISGETKESQKERLSVEIASQKVDVESVVGKGAEVGPIDWVPIVSNHGFNASRLTVGYGEK